MPLWRQTILISGCITIIVCSSKILKNLAVASSLLGRCHLGQLAPILSGWNSLSITRLLLEGTRSNLRSSVLHPRRHIDLLMVILGVLIHVLPLSVRRNVAAIVNGQLLIASVVIKFYLLPREAVLVYPHILLIVQAPKLAGAVAILLVVARDAAVYGTDALPCDQGWQHLLLGSVSLHLTHDVIMILFVQVSYFGEAHLVARVLILDIVKVVLAPSNNVVRIVSVPWVAGHAVVGNTYEIWRGI